MTKLRRSQRLQSAPPLDLHKSTFDDPEGNSEIENTDLNQINVLRDKKQVSAEPKTREGTPKKAMPQATPFQDYSPFRQGLASFLEGTPLGPARNLEPEKPRGNQELRKRLFRDITHEIKQEKNLHSIEELEGSSENLGWNDSEMLQEELFEDDLEERASVHESHIPAKVLKLPKTTSKLYLSFENKKFLAYFATTLTLVFIISVLIKFFISDATVQDEYSSLGKTTSSNDIFDVEEPTKEAVEYPPQIIDIDTSKEPEKVETDTAASSQIEHLSSAISNDSPTMEAFKALVSQVVKQTLSEIKDGPDMWADYALESGGARFVPDQTSPTYPTSAQRPTMARMLAKVGYRSPIPNKQWPFYALRPEISAGNCWLMAGSSGQLSVKLSRSIVPQNFTIDQLSIQKSLKNDVSCAPKDIEVWAVLGESEYQLAEYTLKPDLTESSFNFGLLPEIENSKLREPHQELENSYQPPVQNIKLRILSNWGNQDYTCLYRFRVHGV